MGVRKDNVGSCLFRQLPGTQLSPATSLLRNLKGCWFQVRCWQLALRDRVLLCCPFPHPPLQEQDRDPTSVACSSKGSRLDPTLSSPPHSHSPTCPRYSQSILKDFLLPALWFVSQLTTLTMATTSVELLLCARPGLGFHILHLWSLQQYRFYPQSAAYTSWHHVSDLGAHLPKSFNGSKGRIWPSCPVPRVASFAPSPPLVCTSFRPSVGSWCACFFKKPDPCINSSAWNVCSYYLPLRYPLANSRMSSSLT